jgi:NADPH:quinone reductase-like Zn-dependent oxidoreductase
MPNTCLVHESNALPMPHGFTFTEAAALPETFFTVWHNVFERGGLKPGETLLVHGGTSGIGTTAIQLATQLRREGHRHRRLGGEMRRLREARRRARGQLPRGGFRRRVKEATGGKGADVILDMVGGDYVARNYDAAAIDGRIVQIATQGGAWRAPISPADGQAADAHRLDARPRTVEFKGAIAAELEANVWPLLAERRIAPVMDMIFPLTGSLARA